MEQDAVPGPSVVVDEVVAEARALESRPGFPHEALARIRVATGWLSADDPASDDVRFAAVLLQRQASVGLEPPLAARAWPQRLVKRVVHRLVGWYLRFLAQQISALGQAATRLGLAVAQRSEALQAQADADRAEVDHRLDELSDRLARLEAQTPDRR